MDANITTRELDAGMPVSDVLEHARDLTQTRYSLDKYQTSYSVSLISTRFPFEVEIEPESAAEQDRRERWCEDKIGPRAVVYVENQIAPSFLQAEWKGGRWFRTKSWWFFADREACSLFTQFEPDAA